MWTAAAFVDRGFRSAEIGMPQPSLRLAPDNTDLLRASLAEGDRLATTLKTQVAQIAWVLGLCPACLEDPKLCRCGVGK